MSQMGRVIKALRKLFNDRGEMQKAFERDETLYRAAQDFNGAINEFEIRDEERIKNGH